MESDSFKKKNLEIISRIRSLKPMLGTDNTIGERALRYWILREIFEDFLEWPSEKIVVGETFDALLLDSRNSPVVYLETKALDRKVPEKEFIQALDRFNKLHSLEILVFTDLKSWQIITKAGEQIELNLNHDLKHFLDKIKYKRYAG